eukprot:Em0003g1045a
MLGPSWIDATATITVCHISAPKYLLPAGEIVLNVIFATGASSITVSPQFNYTTFVSNISTVAFNCTGAGSVLFWIVDGNAHYTQPVLQRGIRTLLLTAASGPRDNFFNSIFHYFTINNCTNQDISEQFRENKLNTDLSSPYGLCHDNRNCMPLCALPKETESCRKSII